MDKISLEDANTLSIVARFCNDPDLRAELVDLLNGTSPDAQQIGQALLDKDKEKALDEEHARLVRLYRENWAMSAR